ncbi:MAG: hypothetical protein R3E76_03575 [Planctomycetota bacterium]
MSRYPSITRIDEPLLEFGYGQTATFAKDGLSLYGPLDASPVGGVTLGVVGTAKGIRLFDAWCKRLKRPIPGDGNSRPTFPGFEATFGAPIRILQNAKHVVDEGELRRQLGNLDKHQRTRAVVDLFVNPILRHLEEEDSEPAVWYLVLPGIVKEHCRPLSSSFGETRAEPELRMSMKSAFAALEPPKDAPKFLFEELQKDLDQEAAKRREVAEAYMYAPDFRSQLKVRMLGKAVTQVVQEQKLSVAGQWSLKDKEPSKNEGYESLERNDIAWSILTTTFYKAGGRPWRIHGVRPGVCYLGLVFKHAPKEQDPDFACCAAQLHIDSGDGVVFRGALGPWHTGSNQFHLTRPAAEAIAKRAIDQYRRKTGSPPNELFIHGRARFDADEWGGFASAGTAAGTKVVGIRMAKVPTFKLFTEHNYPPLRGTVVVQAPNRALLWTIGYVPRLGYSMGVGQPNPLSVEVVRGTSDILQVCRDVLSLTKVNYNACIFGDGLPVTLRFADNIGSILTAAPRLGGSHLLPFKWYI